MRTSGNRTFYLSDKTHAALVAQAKAAGISASKMIERLVTASDEAKGANCPEGGSK